MNHRIISENNLHLVKESPPIIDMFRITQEYQHGFKVHEIAEARGLDVSDIHNSLKRCGVKLKTNRRKNRSYNEE